jgi:hypothetical protein
MRGNVSLSTISSFAKDTMTFKNDFSFNKTQAKIQGLSIQIGELFSHLYLQNGMKPNEDSLEALEAYKSLRRLLPREYDWVPDSRHVGATAAHKATQGA